MPTVRPLLTSFRQAHCSSSHAWEVQTASLFSFSSSLMFSFFFCHGCHKWPVCGVPELLPILLTNSKIKCAASHLCPLPSVTLALYLDFNLDWIQQSFFLFPATWVDNWWDELPELTSGEISSNVVCRCSHDKQRVHPLSLYESWFSCASLKTSYKNGHCACVAVALCLHKPCSRHQPGDK